MVKTARRSQRNISRSSASPASASTVSASRQLVLGIKSNEQMKRSAQQTMLTKKPKAKQKTSKRMIDDKPKKPPTAFFYFLEDFRKEFQEQNPDVKQMRDVGKACGDKWKTMSYEEKVKYYDIATEKRAEFDSAMTEYNKKIESGEYEDTDEDSDFYE